MLTLHADPISNTGSSTSGSLRLRLWATAAVYGGGTMNGYVQACTSSLPSCAAASTSEGFFQ
ncbi:MAG: hypothetical protein K1X67_15195 [Fimbriimonadaceae bacterium]|nr:hypothetical protein [Fimbriimonadaceae bacterium]